jgi:membrane-bound lytic murein transglycosylase
MAMLAWTPELEQAIQIQLEYTKNPAQQAVLETLRETHSLEGLDQLPLGKLRVTGYYTPIVYTREKAEKHAKMQGSAFFKHRKGSLKLLSYRGKKAGKEIYRLLGDRPRGASGMPLVAAYSAAVNPAKIPYGSVLLTHIEGEPRLLFAMDTGAKVQRNHEVDVYLGVGEEARRKAMKLHQTREVSLLSLKFEE